MSTLKIIDAILGIALWIVFPLTIVTYYKLKKREKEFNETDSSNISMENAVNLTVRLIKTIRRLFICYFIMSIIFVVCFIVGYIEYLLSYQQNKIFTETIAMELIFLLNIVLYTKLYTITHSEYVVYSNIFIKTAEEFNEENKRKVEEYNNIIKNGKFIDVIIENNNDLESS